MKKLAIIGSNGMLGSDLVTYFNPIFFVTGITKENYKAHVGKKYDIVINANGNSKRYFANQNPFDDFFASTVSVYKSIFDFPCTIYIYISSPDVYENHADPKQATEDKKIDPANLEPYGLNKFLSELIVKKYKKKFLIVRPSMFLGVSLKKGPFFDILQGKQLFVTRKTRLQLVTTKTIAEIIYVLLQKSFTNEIVNVGGIGTFSFSKIQKFIKKKVRFSPDAETQIYEMGVEKIRRMYPSLKTSDAYLQDFLREHPTNAELRLLQKMK